MLKYLNSKKYFEKIKHNGTFLNEELCHEIFKSEINQVVISMIIMKRNV